MSNSLTLTDELKWQQAGTFHTKLIHKHKFGFLSSFPAVGTKFAVIICYDKEKAIVLTGLTMTTIQFDTMCDFAQEINCSNR